MAYPVLSMPDQDLLAGRLLEDLRTQIERLMAADPHGTLRAAAGIGERCYVRACPMPAIPGAGECVCHRVEREQAIYFESQQPSLLVLLESKFAGLPVMDADVFAKVRARSRDRRLALEYSSKLEAE